MKRGIVSKKKKVRIDLVNKKYNGLCSSCQSSLTCTFIRDQRNPILHCEEFEGFEPHYQKNPDKKILFAPSSKVHSNPEIDDLEEYKGLCRICENRKGCTFIRPEGGVWSCEEYQ